MPEPLSPESFYSKHAEEQAATYREDVIGPMFRALRDRFLEGIPGKRVLDAGCGHGRDVEYFVSEGFEAVGIDLSSPLIRHARENKRGDFRLLDFRNTEFGDARFDGVWSTNSLHFLPPGEIEEALSEFRRLLTEGGVLQANFKEGDGRFEKERWGDSVLEFHFRNYEIREMLKKAGFEIESFTTNESVGGNSFLNYLCRKVE